MARIKQLGIITFPKNIYTSKYKSQRKQRGKEVCWMLEKMLKSTDGVGNEGEGEDEAVREKRGKGFHLYYP